VAEHELPDTVEAPATERDPADTVSDQAQLRQALATLPRRQREVVVLRFFVDLSVVETAATLRVSEGTVKAHTNRALARLRDALTATEEVHG
jgi:RNA polymerase sigma factor (sigma-70 family)